VIAAGTGLFVTLEGLSGVGKTTLAPMVADALGAKEMGAVPPAYGGTRASFDDPSLIEARYLYFLSAICRASIEVQTELRRGTDIVVESFLARTVAFHRGMGAKVTADLSAVVATPDVSFHLLCADLVRRRRLAERPERLDSLWDARAERVADRILDEYAHFPMHVIDTTTRGPAAVLDEILSHRLDGGCSCADGESLVGYPDLLSAVSRSVG
jgi:thymidylate kinase